MTKTVEVTDNSPLLALSECKRTEERLRGSENRYRLVAENAADAIWTVGINMQPTYFSPSIARLLGYSVEEAMVRTMEEVFTPDSFELAAKVLAEELAIEKAGQKDPSRSRTMEFELKRKDGSIVPVEIKYSFLRGPDGQPVEILAIARDITERRQAEETLRKSEQKYSALVEQGNDGIVIIQDSLIKFANLKMAETIGFSLEEMPGRPFIDLVSPQYRELVANRYKRRMSGEGITNRYEIEAIAKDGRKIPLEISASVIEYEGRPADMGIVRDITERKKAEEALIESEQKTRTFMDSVTDLFVIAGRNENIIYVNEAMVRTLGYSKEELLGMNISELLSEESRTNFIPRVKELVATGKITTENMWLTKDGKKIVGELVVNAIYDSEGNYSGSRGVFRDITERRRVRQQIEQAAQEWRSTFDAISDWISICDKDFKIIRVNKAFASAFGMKPQEILGRTCYELVHGTKEPRPDCPHRQTLATGEPSWREFFEPHLGIHMEVACSPVFDERGGVNATVHIVRDITERKKMEGQLIVTDRLASIGELASGVAHELNNPLTGVIGFSDLLLDRDLPDDIKEDLEIINREAKRTAGVVKNLLTFARKHPEEKQSVDINQIIEKALEFRAYEHKVNNIQVNTQVAPDLPEISADGFELQQVFINIIINAEYFMIEAHGRGTLTIITERVDDIIRVSFADDGPGIAKGNLGHLFYPFFTTKEVGKGTGLGLSICHGIITEHGGRIYVESELGKGATFIVELPINTSNKEVAVK